MNSLFLWLMLVALPFPSYGQTAQPALTNNLAFYQAVTKNVRFPAAAQRLGKSVRVYVSFTLTDQGGYQNVSVINYEPIPESLKQEVARLWHILPNQGPGYAGNYVIPIAFMLGENSPDQLKPVSNQEDKFTAQDTYTLLKEVSVTGYVVCELRPLTN